MAAVPKRQPQRTCLGCREVRPKRELLRIVRTPEGAIEVDPTGKKSGRGAYVCPKGECVEQLAKSKRLGKALGVEPPPHLIPQLKRFVEEIERG
ncbi:MAG: YlxR family protein [Firmicutes bacterium]|nr:YlxR family protein [Candidatus Fermentithermobacillaceae bacterium]